MRHLEEILTNIQIAGQEVVGIREKYKGKSSLAKKCEETSYKILKNALRKSELPILSKFDQPDFEERENWEEFWIMAPLTGKKSLREGKDDFTIGITRIKGKTPESGILLAPQKKVLYLALHNKAYKIKLSSLVQAINIEYLQLEKHILSKPIPGFFLHILKDKTKMNAKSERFLKDFKDHYGGSLKEVIDPGAMNLCGIAEGKYDLYPHFRPVKEWDIAVFDALIKAAGNRITLKDGILPLQYNTRALHFPAFIAKSNFELDSVDLLK